MEDLENELAKEAVIANKEKGDDDFDFEAMEQTFGIGRNKKTLLCSQGTSLKKLVELSK